MTNITQCPNCSSIFAITDEQYRASKGNVRCGSCREKFDVVFLPQNKDLVLDSDALSDKTKNDSKQSLFEQSDLLRILSQHAKNVDEDEIVDPRIAPNFESKVESDDLNGHSGEFVSGDVDDYRETDLLSTESESDAETLINENDNLDLFTDSYSENTETSVDLFPANHQQDSVEASSHTVILDESSLLDEALLDEVDILIESKLIGSSHLIPEMPKDEEEDDKDEESASDMIGELELDSDDINDEPFNLKPSKLTRLKSALVLFTLTLVSVTLLGSLIYQLWLKQALPDQLAEPLLAATPYVAPLIEELSAVYDIQLPIRQDLNNLRLVSAQTEAHPSRASTILLRVSLLNRSKIEQPLPNLELSLTNETGQLVSRRSFSAVDYLHNNATDNLISPNELKKVTIEFLAFPKQAHGYELKMVK